MVKKRRRLLRVIVRGSILLVVLIALAAGGVLWLFTRSWYIAGRVEPILAEVLGGDVSVTEAEYLGDGRFQMTDVELRVPGLVGDAGRLIAVGTAVVDLDPGALMRGRADVQRVELNDVVVRVSESLDAAGDFNFAHLRPPVSGDVSSDVLPPVVVIGRAEFECGVHRDGVFTEYGRRAFSGSMRPQTASREVYDIALTEVDIRSAVLEGGIKLTGEWDILSRTCRVDLRSLVLDERTFAVCPEIVRIWWRRMGLEGTVDRMSFQFAGPSEFEVQVGVQAVEMTLPIRTEGVWSRYHAGEVQDANHRPRMFVNSGTLVISHESLELIDLHGKLESTGGDEHTVGVPYRVSVVISELPTVDWDDRNAWMERVANTAPFEMTFDAENVDVRSDDPDRTPSIELPSAAARVLERFQLESWTLSTSIALSRAAPGADGTAAPILSSGSAVVTDGRGAYLKFPYALDDIDADLEFTNDRVVVKELHGSADNGATLSLTGDVVPPRNVGAIDMTLEARNVPLDDRLRDALSTQQKQIYDALLGRTALARLAAAGLVPRDADGAPFTLGGTVDLDLSIDRPFGRGHPTLVTGEIRIDSANLLYERLPYPITVQGGTLDWTTEGIVVKPDEGQQGIAITTAGGGSGWISGSIGFAGERRTMSPDITIRIEDDVLNDELLSALPPGADEWGDPEFAAAWPGTVRSRSAERLAQLALTGRLDYEAHLDRQSEVDGGALRYQIDIELRDATLQPADLLASALGRPELADDLLFAMERATATVRVTNGVVTIERLEGRARGAHVVMAGAIEPDGTMDLTIELTQGDLERDLLKLLPDDLRERGRELWDRYLPRGTYEATVTYKRIKGEAEPVSVRLVPRDLELSIGESVVHVRWDAGAIVIGNGGVSFEAVAFALHDAAGDGGAVTLGGRLSADPAAELTGTWIASSFASPIVIELLHWFAAPQQAERLASLQPRGDFDADFRYWPQGRPDGTFGGERDYELFLRPSTVSFVLEEIRVNATLEPEATARLTPGLIELDAMRGAGDDVEFDISGHVSTGPDLVEVDLRLDIEGFARTPQVAVFLPPAVRDMLGAINFNESRPSRLENGKLNLVRDVSLGRGDEPLWTAQFEGRVAVEDAGFVAGMTFTEVTGSAELSVIRVPGTVPVVEVFAQPTHSSVLGQRLHDAECTVRLRPDGESVTIENFSARAGNGVVSADAVVGIGDHKDFAMTTRLVRVPLQDFSVRGPDDAPPDPNRHKPTGDLYATIGLQGLRGDVPSRVGRGTARIVNGDLAALPLIVQVGQMLQFTVPTSKVNYAELEFFITGATSHFEHVRFESTIGDNVANAITGRGTMNIETFAIDGRIRSRGGVAVLRDVVGGIGDQLAAIDVGGTLWEPEIAFIALPGLRGERWPDIVAPPVQESQSAARASAAGEGEEP